LRLQERIKNSFKRIIKQKTQKPLHQRFRRCRTGKTLLVYDLARDLSEWGKTCVIHGALLSGGHIDLNKKIGDFEIISAKDVGEDFDFSAFDFVFVDETQRIGTNLFERLTEAARDFGFTLILSSDPKQILSKEK
jgi:hypothetical protein